MSGRTLVAEVSGDTGIEEYEISPEDFGLSSHAPDGILGGDAHLNARILRDVISGVGRGPARDITLINAGAAIYVADGSGSIKEGVQLAERSIESGAAQDALEDFVKTTRHLSGSRMTGRATILDELSGAAQKRAEELRSQTDPDALHEQALSFEKRDFAAALAAPGLSVISEIKRASPSAGFIREVDPAEVGHPLRAGRRKLSLRAHRAGLVQGKPRRPRCRARGHEPPGHPQRLYR